MYRRVCPGFRSRAIRVHSWGHIIGIRSCFLHDVHSRFAFSSPLGCAPNTRVAKPEPHPTTSATRPPTAPDAMRRAYKFRSRQPLNRAATRHLDARFKI